MWARDEISLVLAEACLSAADVEQHWVMVKDIINSPRPKKLLPASQRGFPTTSLMHSTSGIQWLAQLYLFVCFIHLCFVWKRLIYFSSRGSGLSFSSRQIPEPCVLGASLEEEPACVPWPADQQLALGRWLGPVRRGAQCRGWRARWQVGAVVFGNPQKLQGWSFTLGGGFSSGLGFQQGHGLLSCGRDGKGR